MSGNQQQQFQKHNLDVPAGGNVSAGKKDMELTGDVDLDRNRDHVLHEVMHAPGEYLRREDMPGLDKQLATGPQQQQMEEDKRRKQFATGL